MNENKLILELIKEKATFFLQKYFQVKIELEKAQLEHSLEQKYLKEELGLDIPNRDKVILQLSEQLEELEERYKKWERIYNYAVSRLT